MYFWRMISLTEENYLKALFHLSASLPGKRDAGTSELAEHLSVKPASVHDMLKKLKEKKLVEYEKYGKISLTAAGKSRAVEVIRKHRLWEVFLYEKLGFSWDEIHEVAEQLEHIRSPKLIEKLDTFLGFPKFDPHGDVIPNARGEWHKQERLRLSEARPGHSFQLVAVDDDSPAFLQQVLKAGLGIGTCFTLVERSAFDGLMLVRVNRQTHHISREMGDCMYVSAGAAGKKNKTARRGGAER